MDKEFLAREADRLRNDPILRQAIANVRAGALERMVRADAADTAKVMELQALARACDSIGSELEAMVRSSKERKPPHAV